MTKTDSERPRLLALDVDGTLTRPDKPIDPELIDALNKVADSGTTVVLATGRSHLAVRQLAQRLRPSAYTVLNNGAVVRSIGGDRVLRARHIGLEAARCVLEEFRRQGLFTIWVEGPFAGGRYLVDGAWWTHSAARAYLATKGSAVRPLPAPAVAAPPVHLYAFGTVMAVRAAERRLRARVGEDASLVCWRSARLQASTIEALPGGVTKGEAVAWLADHLDITSSQTLAMGDERNDIEMLRWAGRGVAIAGCPPEVEAAADTVARNDGEGAVRRLVRELWNV